MVKHPLKAFNTFGVPAFTTVLQLIRTEQEAIDLVKSGNKPNLIIGGGSNLLFSGKLLPEVWKNEIMGIKIIHEDDEKAIIEVGGGENWHSFVLWAINQDLGGIENLSLIPGTVGASPIQNIGAYGVELKDVFHSLEALHLEEGKIITFDKPAAQFAYRDSIFKQQKGRYFILKVRFQLHKKHQLSLTYGAIQKTLEAEGIQKPSIRDISNVVIKIRQSKLPDPAQLGNAGSFFKNPIIEEAQFERLKADFPNLVFYPAGEGKYKIPAGWLIDQAGFKGKREGNVGCYKKQALVIVNFGEATGQEILDWASKISEVVLRRYGIALEKEVTVC